MSNVIPLESRLKKNSQTQPPKEKSYIVTTDAITDTIFDFHANLYHEDISVIDIYGAAIENYYQAAINGFVDVIREDYTLDSHLSSQYIHNQDSNTHRELELLENSYENILGLEFIFNNWLNCETTSNKYLLKKVPSTHQLFDNACNFHKNQVLRYLNNQDDCLLSFPKKAEFTMDPKVDPYMKLLVKFSKKLEFNPAVNYQDGDFESQIDLDLDKEIFDREMKLLYNL